MTPFQGPAAPACHGITAILSTPMLLAQARVERSALISVDGRFGDYDVPLLPARPTG